MKKGLYFLLALVVFYSSCKKEEDNTTPAIAAVLKSISQVPSGVSTNYTYDSQGRLETVRNSDGSGMNISYSGDTVTETLMNDSGYVFVINTVFLNATGIATASFLRDTFGGILSYSEYFYDTASFKIDERNYAPSGNQIARKGWSISANNVYYYSSTDSLIYQNNAQISYTYSFERENTIGNDNIGLKYYGKSSKNVEKTMHKTSNATGNIYYTFQYTFDNSGRIATKSAYNHLNELVYTNTYTYN